MVNWSAAGMTTQTNGTQVTAAYSQPGKARAFLHLVVAPAQ